jgi:uncharacterized membrane protein
MGLKKYLAGFFLIIFGFILILLSMVFYFATAMSATFAPTDVPLGMTLTVLMGLIGIILIVCGKYYMKHSD